MGSSCLFTCQWALKMGLRLKTSKHLHTELSLGYLEDTKFYLEIKAPFIDISNIASFKLFLIVWLRKYCTFSDSFVVSLKSSPWPKYTQLGTIFPKKSCSTIKLFSSSNVFFIRLFLANTWKKIGGYRARFKEQENLFRYRAQFEGNHSRFVRARAHVRALMKRKSCAIWMPNAILRNYFKQEKVLRRKEIEPGSTAWKAAMLTTTPPTLCR